VPGRAGRRAGSLRRALALAVATAAAFASPANAIDGDILRARVSAGVTSDSNLFRLPDSVTFPNGASRSELLSYLSVGLDFDRDFSAQRVRAAFNLRDTRYTEYPQLDGFDWSTSLGWTLLEGDQNSLGIDLARSRATLGFADARVLGRPVVDTTSLSMRGALEVVPRWSAIAAVGWVSTANEPVSRSVLDFEQTFVETGARYDFRTGSIVDFVWRHSVVDFVNGNSLGFDNGYSQDDIGLRLDWRVTEVTLLSGRVGLQVRDYADARRDRFTGPGVSLNADWRPRGGLQVVTTLRSELSAPAEINASYARINAVSTTASWLATGKTTLRAGVDLMRRDFRGDGTGGSNVAQRRDLMTALTGAISIQVWRTLELGADLRFDRRDSNVDSFDYFTRIFTLRAGMVF
jgi:hypothetical protein